MARMGTGEIIVANTGSPASFSCGCRNGSILCREAGFRLERIQKTGIMSMISDYPVSFEGIGLLTATDGPVNRSEKMIIPHSNFVTCLIGH